MRNAKTREYLKLLAREENLSVEGVRAVVESPFHFTRHVMENEVDRETLTVPSIRIPYFGILHCPDYVKEKYRSKNQKK